LIATAFFPDVFCQKVFRLKQTFFIALTALIHLVMKP